MRIINHRFYRRLSLAAVLWISSLDALSLPAAHALPLSAPSRTSNASVRSSSLCEGSWLRPGYSLTIVQSTENGFFALLEVDDAPTAPITGDISWGTVQRPGAIGTIERAAFEAEFAEYGHIKLTCTPNGAIDQYGRRLTPDLGDDQDIITVADGASDDKPSWKAVQDSTVDAARMSLLMPYLDKPAEAASITYPDLPGWLFFRTAAFCYLSREKDDGRLLIGYNRATNTAHLGFTADKLAPLADGTELKLDIVMANINHQNRTAQPIRYWNPLKATVLIGRHSGEPVYNFKLNGRQALTSFSRHDFILFMKGEEALQGFPLNGSAAAIKRLETCDPR